MSGPANGGGARAPRRLRRVLIWIAALTAGALVVAVLAVAWLTGTPPGSRWTLARAAALGGVRLDIGALDGSIMRGLVLERVHAGLEGVTLDASRLALTVDWSALVERRVTVRRLDVDGLRVTAAPDTAPPAPREAAAGMPEISLPLQVIVREARIDDALWRGPDGDTLALEALRLAGAMRGSDVRIERLTVVSPAFDADMNGEVEMHGDWPLALAIGWIVRPDSLPQISGEGEVRGSLARLVVEQRVTAPHALTLTAELRDVPGRLTFDARARTDGMPLGTWWEAARGAELTADARVSGAPDSMRVRADARVAGVGGRAYDLELSAAQAGDAVRLERLRISAASGSLDVAVSGLVRGLGPEPRGEVAIVWTQMAWPPGAPALESAGGTLRLDGTPAAWTAVLDGEFTAPLAGSSRWRARVRGDTASARIDTLTGGLLGGGLHARGDVRWAPEVTWRGRIEARGIDPGTRWPAWAGSLAAGLETEGRMGSGGPEGRVRIERLEGRLRGRALEGSGDARFTPDAVALDGLEVDWGAARLAATGMAGRTWSLQASLHAPDLSLWWPGARGSIDAEARVEGPRAEPRVFARARGDSLGFRDWRAGHLELDADADLAGDRESTVRVAVAELGNPAPLARRIVLSAAGTPAAHRIEGHLVREGDSLDVEARGAYEEERWDGRLARLDLDSDVLGDWRLVRPARVTLAAAGEMSLDSLDWGSGDARIAASGGGDGERGWEVRATLERLALERLGVWMPEGMDVRGPLGAELYAHVVSGRVPQIALRATAGPGEIAYTIPAGPQTSAFDTAVVVWTSDSTGARGTLDFHAPGLLVANGRLQLPGFASGAPGEPQPVDGRLDARVPHLSAFAGMWPDLEGIRGVLSTNLRMNGTTAAPQFTGEARLEDGAARLPAAGLELADASLRIEGDGSDSLTVNGTVRSGPGSATLSGRIAATRLDSLRANLAFQGRRIRILDLPNARLIGSPDLRIALDDNRVEVSGEVRVPRGELTGEAGGAREAVALSPDVVIEDQDTDTQRALELRTTVRVVLGDSISLDAFGLKANPRGTVLITERPGQDPVASGELTLAGGTYTAYGQQLTIERGRLLYAGGPLTNPGLDIRAVRLARDGTVAGLEIRGTALDPQVSIFSDPDMPEEQALAYIVLGRPLENAGTGEGRVLENAARSAGLKGGNLLASKIASQIGLDEASIETGDEGTFEEASLMLGTHLSPRVYLGYAVGLFKPANAFLIRYRIGSRWAIEAEAAEENSAEIQFTTER